MEFIERVREVSELRRRGMVDEPYYDVFLKRLVDLFDDFEPHDFGRPFEDLDEETVSAIEAFEEVCVLRRQWLAARRFNRSILSETQWCFQVRTRYARALDSFFDTFERPPCSGDNLEWLRE